MVASVAALTSAGQAASYYEADDYYAEGGFAPSEWRGEGAKALGLEGEVSRDQFKALLEGQLPNGTQLGRMQNGELDHRPGWDVTLSAPKSVSIMAEVAGDRRLIQAHNRAVSVALTFAEKHAAATRIREGGEIRRERTANLVIASFRHETSRAEEPQLHSHNVILNATRDAEGNWRSLEPRALYQLQKHLGALYRQELAAEVQTLGYGIIKGKDATFEIDAVPKELIEAFSSRSAQIDKWFEDRGLDKAHASAEQKELAVLDTRNAKAAVDRGELVQRWREVADELGMNQMARRAKVEVAKAKAAEADYALMLEGRGELAAHKAAAEAVKSLSERQSVLSTADIMKQAGEFGFGEVRSAHVVAAIQRAEADGVLIARDYKDQRGATFEGFTTRRALETEQAMLEREAAGRGKAHALATPMESSMAVARGQEASKAYGHDWNKAQIDAVRHLLTSKDQVNGIQGYAGTAKTSTVLATVAKEATRKGMSVTALAPTASAAQTLGESLDQNGLTVARHLRGAGRPSGQSQGKDQHSSLWIVDEASLLSTRDMDKLLEKAQEENAKVILVGDVKQLGSVGAGAAFAQLQENGMATAKLADIVRQSNLAAKEAVEAAIEGDARKAFAALDKGGGTIHEHQVPDQRLKAMARDYAKMDAEQRASTIVIEPSRAGRDNLNAMIRERLIERGELGGEAVTMRTLHSKSLTKAEAKQAMSYEEGDVIRFAKAYPAKRVAKHQELKVASVNADKKQVMLESEDGRQIDWRPAQWGAAKSEAFVAQDMELRQGDKIMFTRNDHSKTRQNGLKAEVLSIDAESRTTQIRLSNGKQQSLDLDSASDQHLRHGYAQTAYAAQGRTAEQVMIHADSRATNLIDQRSFYVALSRAKQSAQVYTDDRAKLTRAIAERAGEKQVAMEGQESRGQSLNSKVELSIE